MFRTTELQDKYVPKTLPDAHSSTVRTPPEDPQNRPKVIGIYGISGCGKTTLLNQLKHHLNDEFAFYDGSELIERVFDGTLSQFQASDPEVQKTYRELAIKSVMSTQNDGKTAIIAGHAMLCDGSSEALQPIWTDGDTYTYTHVIYLDTPVDVVQHRRLNDQHKQRSLLNKNQLRIWQHNEMTWLRKKCYDSAILFYRARCDVGLLDTVMALLEDFRTSSEHGNILRAKERLDRMVGSCDAATSTLVFDGDKTLSATDTGQSFWWIAKPDLRQSGLQSPLEAIFKSRLQYSHTAFKQVQLLYREHFSSKMFREICKETAAATQMYSELVSLLKLVAEQRTTNVVLITCGLGDIWEAIVKEAGLSDQVKVIGGGMCENDVVVTPKVKAELVKYLQEEHKQYVWAFGDSPVDIPMLREADKAIVVVGDEKTRSKSMDTALLEAMQDGLRAHQALLPPTATPRMDLDRLPAVDLTHETFIDEIFNHSLEFIEATNKTATRLLMTPMRNTTVHGPTLQAAHRTVGYHLAISYVTEVLGVESYNIKHVLGTDIKGYRLRHETRTVIVAMMRGGEPMAQGVNDAFPHAMFVHAKLPSDLTPAHLANQRTVILVDSVINNGTSMNAFIRHVHRLSPTLRIVLVTGVAQSQSIDRIRSVLHDVKTNRVGLVALRLSDTKFTGRGPTDTGNRLFNTTALD